jgi:zinc transport system substrate-binding protein
MKTGLIRLLAVAAAGIGILLFSGCNGSKAANTSGGAHKGIKIVTSFYPMYISTINIAKDIPDVTVINMTGPQTGCLHDYSLKTGDLKIIEDADIFIINGAGMESFINKVIQQQPDLKIVDASKGIKLLKDEANGMNNPHIWVSVSGAIRQVGNIGEQLAMFDTRNAIAYRRNTDVYTKKLKALREEMHKELDIVKDRNIITFHEAFPYFAQEFNLNIKAVIEHEPGSDPGPGELTNTIDMINRFDVMTLFTEPQYSSKTAEVISRETGAKVYVLDPVVTGEADGDTDAYIKKMKTNMKTLKEALNR